MPSGRTKPKLIKRKYKRKTVFKSTVGGLLVGLVSGGVAIVYRFSSNEFQKFHHFFLGYATNVWMVILYFAIFVLMALAVRKIITWEPFVAGSGISEVRGEVQGYFKMNWLKVLIGKFAGCLLAMAGGLSLGREGPSVQMGAMAGKGLAKISHRGEKAERYLITCGASAGLSAAFNCPLTGVMFALETFNPKYSVNLLFTAMVASVTADFVSKICFGMSPVFSVPLVKFLPLTSVGFVILLGVFCGITGKFFNWSMKMTRKFYEKLPLPNNMEPLIPFLTAGILGFVLPDILGDGDIILSQLVKGKFTLTMIAVLLAVKFGFSMLCFTIQNARGFPCPDDGPRRFCRRPVRASGSWSIGTSRDVFK
jgi:H+/Cl- antiporter ClcA